MKSTLLLILGFESLLVICLRYYYEVELHNIQLISDIEFEENCNMMQSICFNCVSFDKQNGNFCNENLFKTHTRKKSTLKRIPANN